MNAQTDIARARGVSNLYDAKFKEFQFEGKWYKAFGKPERGGHWCVWGGSGQGKTSFTIQMARYLAQWDKVYFNAIETAWSKATKIVFKKAGVRKGEKISIIDESFSELVERLRKSNAKIVIIDSVDYWDMNNDGFTLLRKEFKHVLFIWICHGSGKEPDKALSISIKRMAHVKARVDCYVASCETRFENSGEYVIWEEGARKLNPKQALQ